MLLAVYFIGFGPTNTAVELDKDFTPIRYHRSFRILMAMAQFILPTFAHVCFIGFCPAVVTSNPVCGRMLKKQGGAEAENICRGHMQIKQEG